MLSRLAARTHSEFLKRSLKRSPSTHVAGIASRPLESDTCYSGLVPSASQVKPTVKVFRHSAVVRATHWLTFIAFIGLLISGGEIVIPHPRFYWGEEGNVNTKPLFVLPIPASRDTVPTSYHYVLADENGWGRSLHFQSAWLVVLTGLVYGIYGFASGHFRKGFRAQA